MNYTMSSHFQIIQVVRQGCVMLPWLFSMFMVKTEREILERLVGGVQLSTTTVRVVLFADDVMLISDGR